MIIFHTHARIIIMAANLERFLIDQLRDLPENHPDKSFLERELLKTQLFLLGIDSPKEILTEDFAMELNKLASNIPPDTRINQLLYDRHTMVDHELPSWLFS